MFRIVLTGAACYHEYLLSFIFQECQSRNINRDFGTPGPADSASENHLLFIRPEVLILRENLSEKNCSV